MATLALKSDVGSKFYTEILSANSSFEYEIQDIFIHNTNPRVETFVELSIDINGDEENIFRLFYQNLKPSETHILNLSSSISLDNANRLIAKNAIDNVNITLLGKKIRRN